MLTSQKNCEICLAIPKPIRTIGFTLEQPLCVVTLTYSVSEIVKHLEYKNNRRFFLQIPKKQSNKYTEAGKATDPAPEQPFHVVTLACPDLKQLEYNSYFLHKFCKPETAPTPKIQLFRTNYGTKHP
ncbi:MAG: hypothetical protein LBJ00_13985 [Planctomycetaceae bacterium]|jgi:hypothetical protein|nr:hypothetical protein [Planctomycetaceae bacterium]